MIEYKKYITKEFVMGLIIGVAITSFIGFMFMSVISLNIANGGSAKANSESDALTENEVAEQPEAKGILDKLIPGNAGSKTGKPSVELFVMSHCPYGLQMEKGIIPAVETLGDKVDFKLKFTDYAMHGEKELKEQLNQYCIQKDQKSKLLPYLKCFVKSGDSTACLSQTGVNTKKLASCIDKTDKEFSIIKNFQNNIGFKGTFPSFDIYKADNQKYGVAGSPTLVINGTKSQAGRDPSSLLKAICATFESAPKECEAVLPSSTPSSGFGEGTQPGGSGSGGCN